MSKISILCTVLVVALASTSYGVVIGNWEGSDDNWGYWNGSSVVVPATNFSQQSTWGVTLDSQALKVVQPGWAQALALDLTYAQRVDLANNCNFSIDFSVAPATSGGRLIIEEVVLNAEGFGWTPISSGQSYFDCWEGSGYRTMNLSYSYDPSSFGSGSGPGIPGYAQIVITLNGYGGQTDFYFDKAELTPEPTTIVLLGLGGLALLRRKR